MRYHILSINTPSYIPVMRYVIRFLAQTSDVAITESRLKNSYTFPPIQVTAISSFEGPADFNQQSWKDKLRKYQRITRAIWRVLATREPAVIYAIDYQVLAIVLCMNGLLRNGRVKFIYHQLETIEQDRLRGQNLLFWRVFARFSRNISLAILPEKNRLSYLLSITKIDSGRTLLLANTCEPSEARTDIHPALRSIPENATLIGHIGSIGEDHYATSFFEAINAISDDETKYVVMAGNYSSAIRHRIAAVRNPRFILIEAVPHAELPQIFSRIDIGLVLYKAVDRNFEYCAPNKLYEYWSHGIPVIAHPLAGLTPLFTQPFMGSLIDLSRADSLVQHLSGASRRSVESSQHLRNYFERHLSIGSCLAQLETALRTHCNAQKQYLAYCGDSPGAH